MLTVMCPNCRHRFPAPGCCNPGAQGTIVANNEDEGRRMLERSETPKKNEAFYGGGYLLVPREYGENNRGCFINAPTIIHGPTIIQQPTIFNKIGNESRDNDNWIKSFNNQHQHAGINVSNLEDILGLDETKIATRMNDFSNCHIDTTCDLTGGTVTITTPNIQSGGCLIRNKDTEITVQSPRIEIRPKLSVGGGYFVQKHSPVDLIGSGCLSHRENNTSQSPSSSCSSPCDTNPENTSTNENLEGFCLWPPSGCQELPGIRRSQSITRNPSYNLRFNDPTDKIHCNNDLNSRYNNQESAEDRSSPQNSSPHSNCCCSGKNKKESSSGRNTERNSPPCDPSSKDNVQCSTKRKSSNELSSGSMEIRVNATVQLPPNVEHCTVNITATTANPGSNDFSKIVGGSSLRRDNFNGGGLVHFDTNNESTDNEQRHEDPPTTPLSWLMPCPWGFDNYSIDKDFSRLKEVKRILQISGWYHEGLSWQQSEQLLKNTPVGRWLMRDSSDSRFVFAVSVQTARGPTSVRVHYFLGRFRLDAEPRLSLAMPLFECPVKMLQHYVDYSKRIDEHRKEVWVDYSGQLYSQIYLTKPLVKDVQSLSHLARIAVNRYKLNTQLLPPLIKNYLAEYPYSL
ncbi:uncharacterized protein [Venturia canescens]|uniref:uncharacterized protein n=1 Tax=Venturia canescens TaxID=32260 RepID=UPI001C9D545C|nr:uncharacterized protein LOC122413703 [Venturia canescens]XP_043280154.1 uncharacterized protein LOC122413703 [Venturia canescens]XP_043280155.1 uncharacterized protein LOC122413703 [Venturia canescens]XP_043280156.1 uncharacterized protein LOC122413703 [Venturia canescens]